jgi:hypothetical protein
MTYFVLLVWTLSWLLLIHVGWVLKKYVHKISLVNPEEQQNLP